MALGPWAAGAEIPDTEIPDTETPSEVAVSDRTYQGQAPGEALAADVELRILSLDGQTLYAESHGEQALDGGLFALRLGDGEPLEGWLEDALRAPGGLVELHVDGEPVGPPEPVASLPQSRLRAIDPPSPGLRVFDGYGAQLGLYAGERIAGSDTYFVHRPDAGLTFALQADTGELGTGDVQIFFDEPGCGGKAFVERRLSGVVFERTPHGFRVGTATQALGSIVVRSRRDAGGTCHDETVGVRELVPVTEIEAVPLALPAAPPLHVGIVPE